MYCFHNAGDILASISDVEKDFFNANVLVHAMKSKGFIKIRGKELALEYVKFFVIKNKNNEDVIKYINELSAFIKEEFYNEFVFENYNEPKTFYKVIDMNDCNLSKNFCMPIFWKKEDFTEDMS